MVRTQRGRRIHAAISNGNTPTPSHATAPSQIALDCPRHRYDRASREVDMRIDAAGAAFARDIQASSVSVLQAEVKVELDEGAPAGSTISCGTGSTTAYPTSDRGNLGTVGLWGRFAIFDAGRVGRGVGRLQDAARVVERRARPQPGPPSRNDLEFRFRSRYPLRQRHRRGQRLFLRARGTSFVSMSTGRY
jgi:hypothetical protein